ncbi:MAG: hypothetical protein R3344_05770, partial [Acidobacteriota bacterium]|nr:hypothetical protein [Acidobacteriota bacterium]
MSSTYRHSTLLVVILSLAASSLVFGGKAPAGQETLRQREIRRPGAVIGEKAVPVSELPAADELRLRWDAFAASREGEWKIWIDERTGLPRMAMGAGIPWIPGAGNDLDPGAPSDTATLESLARALLDDHAAVLGRWDEQLVLDPDASVQRGEHVRQVVFRQEVGGVRVEGARYDFHLSHGNLVAFGAHGWAPVSISPTPAIDETAAAQAFEMWLGETGTAILDTLKSTELVIVTEDPAGNDARSFGGKRGEGYAHRLIWRLHYTDATDFERWATEIDAHTGVVVAFYDTAHYDRVRGSVYPITNDSGDGGMLVADFPMPFAGISEISGPLDYANQHGLFECTTPGALISTTLHGRYVSINEQCGFLQLDATCGEDLDLGVATTTNCGTGPGSMGNTNAARTTYFTVSNLNRKARFWHAGGNAWLDDSLTAHTNVNLTCNARWDGEAINFYRQGNNCANNGEMPSVIAHEWGHGYDYNDGGDGTITSEAFADVVSMFEMRDSCMSRGWKLDGSMCMPLSDPCLSCDGTREMDWDARTNHTPATPQNFSDVWC